MIKTTHLKVWAVPLIFLLFTSSCTEDSEANEDLGYLKGCWLPCENESGNGCYTDRLHGIAFDDNGVAYYCSRNDVPPYDVYDMRLTEALQSWRIEGDEIVVEVRDDVVYRIEISKESSDIFQMKKLTVLNYEDESQNAIYHEGSDDFPDPFSPYGRMTKVSDIEDLTFEFDN